MQTFFFEKDKINNFETVKITKYSEIVKSDFFNEYLKNITSVITSNRSLRPEVKLIFGDATGRVINSLTGGNIIYINAENEVINQMASNKNKINILLGFIFHELAHVLFYNIKEENQAIGYVAEGKVPFDFLTLSKEELEYEKEIKEYICNENYTKIFFRIYSEIGELISDYHDEEKLCMLYGKLINTGIITLRESQFSMVTPIDHMEKSEEFCYWAVIISAIYQYCRFGVICSYGEESYKIIEILKEVIPFINNAKATDSVKEKYSNINMIIIKLWPIIKEKLDSSKEENGNDEFDSGDEGEEEDNSDNQDGGKDNVGKPEDIEDFASQLDKAKASSGGESFSKPPENINGKNNKETEIPDDFFSEAMESELPLTKTKNNSNQNDMQETDDLIENIITETIKSIRAESDEENKIKEKNKENLMKINTGDINAVHSGISINFITVLASIDFKNEYYEYIERNRFYIKKIKKEIENIMIENEVTRLRYRYFGREFDLRNIYRLDQKYFLQKKNPEKKIDMAISILVDNSGSMDGIRLDAAKEATVLLLEVLEKLNIPVCITGHCCECGLEFSVYKNFEDISNAKYSICKMKSKGNNRDGMALFIAGNMLKNREEENKLLIIISDGQPNAHGYGGELAKKDIQSVVKNFRQNQIKTIALAIGDDKPQIKEIYGEAFIDISDYDKFPRVLANLIKREIISNV